MRKDGSKEQDNKSAVKQLTPSLAVVTDLHNDLMHPKYTIASNNNEYVLVELKNGEEVIGSDFIVSETTFRTSFAKNANFKVKKNPK